MSLLVVGALLVVVLFVAFKLGLHIDPENAPTGSPGWSGPDAAAIVARLEARLREPSPDPPEREPHLDELASHHAFDMATRRFDSETTPEGEDLQGRRLRLCPKLVGEAAQWQTLAPLETGWTDPDRLLDALIGPASPRGAQLHAALEGPEIQEIGLGVAVERGSVALCVVMMNRWMTLEDTSPAPAHDGVSFLGELGPHVQAEEITARFRTGAGPWSSPTSGVLEDLGEFEGDHPRLVRVHIPVAPDAEDVEVQFLRGGVAGRIRRWS